MLNLDEYLNLGQNAIVQKVVRPEDTSEKYTCPFKDLLASPKLIHWAIDASIDAVDPYLPEEYASIGIYIEFLHTAPTCVGMTVTVHVTVTEIKNNIVTCDVKAWDEQGEIGQGLLKRAVIETNTVISKVKERTKPVSSRRVLNWAKL